MNKKYLLSTILVLLVITIGVSFSYFVSKTAQNNLENANTQIPTAKIPEFKLETNVNAPTSLPIYPGTKNYISASVKGIKTGGEEDDTTEYQIKYRITGSVSITEAFTQGSVTYKLYKTTEPIEKPIVCKDVTGTQGEDDKQTEVHYSQECTLNEKLTNEVTLKDDINGGSIQSGTATFTYEDTIPADNKTVHYYYLVVEYPETKDDQSLDMGKSVTYSINSIVSIETGIKESESKKSFDELAKLNNTLTSNGQTATFTGNSCKNGTNDGGDCDLQENGIYEAEDDDGTSYYFRGTVENNYVKFGKMGSDDNGEDIWWRIIRINGDGSIRMIYAGTSDNDSVPNQTNGTSVITVGSQTTFTYSPGGARDNNKYVGFEYQDNIRNGNSKEENGHKSNALEQLNTWFEENLSDEFNNGVNTKINTDAGFCGDRSAYDYDTYELNNELGINRDKTYYGGYIRTAVTHQPTFQCEDKEHDLFTYTGSTQGTKSLEYPIGLTTIDEQVYAGNHWSDSNKGYYLYNGANYWPMSPCFFGSSYAYVFSVDSDGGLGNLDVRNSRGLRPVLNLVSGALKLGTGLSTDPYRVS